MDDFTPIDAHAVHHAMLNTREAAKKRRAKSPSSADSFERQADELKIVRDKILDRLPPDVHRSYPDYG